MKKAILVLAVLAVAVGLANSAMAQNKPPRVACYALTDGGNTYRLLLTAKPASPNVNMLNQRSKAYAVIGEMSWTGGGFTLPVGVVGSGHVHGDTMGQRFYHVTFTGGVEVGGAVRPVSGILYWNLTDGTGTININNNGVHSFQFATVIGCETFRFPY